MSKLEFNVDSIKFSVGLESVLCGHEGWVYGLQWAPRNGIYFSLRRDKKKFV